jgi:beta-1,4-N-acetylglucosaminyltransferase
LAKLFFPKEKVVGRSFLKKKMTIFVTVGTHPQSFRRLIIKMDELATKHPEWSVFGQIGHTDYTPKHFPFTQLIPETAYSKKIAQSDVVISHGGAGAIIHAMQMRKKLVLVPRLEKFNEHTNDHQLDLARSLEKSKKVISVQNVSDLEKALKKTSSFHPDFDSTRKKLITGLGQWLSQ